MLLLMAVFRRLVQGLLVLHSLFDVALGADNGVARLPPMGYNQWNFFHNNFNVTRHWRKGSHTLVSRARRPML